MEKILKELQQTYSEFVEHDEHARRDGMLQALDKMAKLASELSLRIIVTKDSLNC